MKRGFVIFVILLVSVISSGCATVSRAKVDSSILAAFKHPWEGKTYDKIFNAAVFALNTNNETVIEADRSSGVIHTRFYNQEGKLEGNGYYLITPGSDSVYYSASTVFEISKELDQTPKETGPLNWIIAGSEAEQRWIKETKILLDKALGTRKDMWELNQLEFIKKVDEAYKTLNGNIGKK